MVRRVGYGVGVFGTEVNTATKFVIKEAKRTVHLLAQGIKKHREKKHDYSRLDINAVTAASIFGGGEGEFGEKVIRLSSEQCPTPEEIGIPELEPGYHYRDVASGYVLRIDSGKQNSLNLGDDNEIHILSSGIRRILVDAYESQDKKKIFVAFGGMTGDNKHEYSNILKTMTGAVSGEMYFAKEIVAAYKKKYPQKEIIPVGFSMGGGYATYAAMKNNTAAITFNAMGLSHLRIVDHRAHKERIQHINTKKDPLHILQKPFMRQYGQRFTVPSEAIHEFDSNFVYDLEMLIRSKKSDHE